MGGRAEARKRRREIETTRRGGVHIGAQGRRSGPGVWPGVNGWASGAILDRCVGGSGDGKNAKRGATWRVRVGVLVRKVSGEVVQDGQAQLHAKNTL